MKKLLRFALVAATLVSAQRRDLRLERDEHRVALVIGNNAYARAPLKNAVNDAMVFGRTLRELGFDVELITDANGQAMDQAVDRLTRKLRTGDVALFYFAGHGVQIEGSNYLIPTDFSGDQPTDVKYKAVSGPWVLDRLDATGARLKVIILDACRNNPFRGARAMSGGLGQMSAARGSFIAFATGPGQVADDNVTGSNGLFTDELVKAIRLPNLSLDDVFTRVREAVDKRSGGQQLPWTSSSVLGRFSFRVDQPDSQKPEPYTSNIRPATVRVNPKDGLKYVWIEPGTFSDGLLKRRYRLLS